jgi:hypothetical protein
MKSLGILVLAAVGAVGAVGAYDYGTGNVGLLPPGWTVEHPIAAPTPTTGTAPKSSCCTMSAAPSCCSETETTATTPADEAPAAEVPATGK